MKGTIQTTILLDDRGEVVVIEPFRGDVNAKRLRQVGSRIARRECAPMLLDAPAEYDAPCGIVTQVETNRADP